MRWGCYKVRPMKQSKITVEEVQKVAGLARLSLNEDECQALSCELSDILDYVAMLDEIDVSAVTATAHTVVRESPLREDELAQGLSRDEALSQAPTAHDGGFAVPKVLEGDS